MTPNAKPDPVGPGSNLDTDQSAETESQCSNNPRRASQGRAPYVVASSTARDVIRRAAEHGLSGKDHRVLEAVISRTALYSRLEERCYLAQIAAEAHGVERAEPWMLEKARKSLSKLRRLGLVGYEPPQGRPPGRSGPAYRVWLTPSETPPETGLTSEPEKQPDSVGKAAPIRLETQPEIGGPREEVSEKHSEQQYPAPVRLEAQREINAKKQRGEEIRNEYGLFQFLCQQIAETKKRERLNDLADQSRMRSTIFDWGRGFAWMTPEALEEQYRRSWPEHPELLEAAFDGRTSWHEEVDEDAS